MLEKLRLQPTVESFAVAGRDVSLSWSVATLWAIRVQIFALLLGQGYAYKSPWQFAVYAGFNTLMTALMGIIAYVIIRRMEKPLYTVQAFLGQEIGPWTQTLTFISSVVTCFVIVTATLAGIQQWFTQIFGIASFTFGGVTMPVSLPTVVILVLLAVAAVRSRGLPAAIAGDSLVKDVLLTVLMAGTIGYFAYKLQSPVSTLFGELVKTGNPGELWDPGLKIAIAAMSGALCNPDCCERLYAVSKRSVFYAFAGAAALYGVAVCVFGMWGPMAKILGLKVSSTQIPVIAVLQHEQASFWFLVAITAAICLITLTAVASMLASTSNMVVFEFYRRFNRPDATDSETIRWSRRFMLFVLVVAIVGAAYNPPLEVIYPLFGYVRGVMVVPLLLAVFYGRGLSDKVICVSIIVADIFAIYINNGTGLGQFVTSNAGPLGALCVLFGPLVLIMLASLLARSVRQTQAV